MSNLTVKSNSKKQTIYNGIVDIKTVFVTLPMLTLDARDKESGVGGKTDPIAEYDASSLVPEGYEILLVSHVGTSSNQVYNYYLEHSDKKILYQYRNVSYSEQSFSPTCKLLLIKRNTE